MIGTFILIGFWPCQQLKFIHPNVWNEISSIYVTKCIMLLSLTLLCTSSSHQPNIQHIHMLNHCFSQWLACLPPTSFRKSNLSGIVQDTYIFFSCMCIRKYVSLYFIISETDFLKSLWSNNKNKIWCNLRNPRHEIKLGFVLNNSFYF